MCCVRDPSQGSDGSRGPLSVCEPSDTRKNRKTTNAEVHGYPLGQEIFEKSKCGTYEYYSAVC